ncbi:MAG: 30S ribosomal protein S16, partial [Bacteroidales bacterium]|nr:30S ribosomal protein S16 [Bacteroidales bacterium]
MPTRIRLQRHGKKGQPFYHIVIADGRAPRDGRFIEKIGTYNPVSRPAEINIDFDRAIHWIQVGAQPSDTVRTLLSHKGVMYKNHLEKGIKKGALTQQQADLKFQEWEEAKQAKIERAQSELLNKERSEVKKRTDAEAKINEDRLAEIARRRAAEVEKQVAEARARQEEAKAKEEASAKELADAKEEARAK